MADEELRRVLGEIRRRGGIGTASVEESIAHSDAFVRLLPADAATAVDLGSGGGLPALVIAARRPDLRLTLVERRGTRADLLRYGVRALGFGDRVEVTDVGVDEVIGAGIRFDAVTARSFAPLPRTLAVAAALLGDRGTVLVSARPEAHSVPGERLRAWELVDRGIADGIHRFERCGVPRGTSRDPSTRA